MNDEVDHRQLMKKLVEHESKFVRIADDIKGIREDLDPIATGVTSIAWAFKGLLLIGAGSAAVVGILEMINHWPLTS
jgi:hypothetical protein